MDLRIRAISVVVWISAVLSTPNSVVKEKVEFRIWQKDRNLYICTPKMTGLGLMD